jgi:hypothetical protein
VVKIEDGADRKGSTYKRCQLVENVGFASLKGRDYFAYREVTIK